MERYEYVNAIICCGELRWKYKVEGCDVSGSMPHDEDVSDWTDEEIIDLTCNMLDVSDDQRGLIEVIRD